MQADNQATALVIQMMPLLMREFQVRLDPQLFFSDPQYADTVIGLATDEGSSDRLRGIGESLRIRLARLTAGPAGAARSSRLVPGQPQAPGGFADSRPPAPLQHVPPPPAVPRGREHLPRQEDDPIERLDEPDEKPAPGRYLRSLR
jgi:hypothetical protein